MPCGPCARRRKALEAKRQQAKSEGKNTKAAVIGAALAVTDMVGKAINGEVDDERVRRENQGNG